MANDIASWIHSQLADINEETAIKDLKELKEKEGSEEHPRSIPSVG